MNSETRFAVVCPAWQCERWVGRCLRSIQAQTYRNFRCVLIDDLSDDRTYDVAVKVVAGDDRFRIVRNDTRRFPLANLLAGAALTGDEPDDVIVVVDGDDWLKHDRVFERVAQEYADPQVWLTYGSHELLRRPWRDVLRGRRTRGEAERYPDGVLESGLVRYFPRFQAGHLRTCRRFLWQAVRDEDLRDDDGSYYWSAGDLALVLPMLEMATARHIRFIPDILYVYNNDHPLAENREENRARKRLLKLRIKARRPYAPLRRP